MVPKDAAVPPENSPFIARTRPRTREMAYRIFPERPVADNKRPDQRGSIKPQLCTMRAPGAKPLIMRPNHLVHPARFA